MKVNRRQWLGRLAAGGGWGALAPFRSAAAHEAAAPAAKASPAPSPAAAGGPLALKDFQPKSMLHVAEHKVARARFPAIDVHTHLGVVGAAGSRRRDEVPGHAGGAPRGHGPQERADDGEPDRRHRRRASRASIRRYEAAAPGRFITFTEPSWARFNEPGYPQMAGRRDRAGEEGGRARAEGPEDVWGSSCASNVTTGPAGQDRRPALRSHVGRLRPPGHAGGHPRLRSRGVLPAHRPLQRALRGAVQPPGLVVPRPRLPADRAASAPGGCGRCRS